MMTVEDVRRVLGARVLVGEQYLDRSNPQNPTTHFVSFDKIILLKNKSGGKHSRPDYSPAWNDSRLKLRNVI